MTFERSKVWSSDLLLWQDAVAKNPVNERAHMGIGDAYLERGRCADAVNEFETVERLHGVTDEMTANLAAAYQCDHQPELALKTLRPVAAKRPSAAFYCQIGYLEGIMGHTAEAMEALNQALALDSRSALAFAYRGIIYLTAGDRAKALSDLQQSLEIEPGNRTATQGMALYLGRR